MRSAECLRARRQLRRLVSKRRACCKAVLDLVGVNGHGEGCGFDLWQMVQVDLCIIPSEAISVHAANQNEEVQHSRQILEQTGRTFEYKDTSNA